MSNIKKVTLDGSEVKIETGGQNTIVKNLSTDTIYASAFPNITAEADNVAEIASGTGEVIYGTHGTVYLLGKGRVQCTGTDYATVNFKKPSRSKGGGGKNYKTMTAVIDLSNSNAENSVTYADDAANMTAGSAEWDNFFGHYPCLFKDGAEVGKLRRIDFNKFEDGTTADISSGGAGDVMIAFPRRGLKIETIDNKVYVSMTDDPNSADFEYNAHTRGETAKDVFYLGAYKGYVGGSKLRSLKGKTITGNKIISTFRTYAQANGEGYEQSGFYQLTFRQAMFILKYKTLDSQSAVGTGYVGSSGGFNPIPTGGTEEWGMDCEIIKISNPTYMTDQYHHVKCFGIEDFWGNLWEWIDGLVSDNSRNILTANSGFNDAGTGYENNGNGGVTADVDGIMAIPQGTTKTGFVVKAVSTSDGMFCDYSSLFASCVPGFGGRKENQGKAGVFDLCVDEAAGHTGTAMAARLMYL